MPQINTLKTPVAQYVHCPKRPLPESPLTVTDDISPDTPPVLHPVLTVAAMAGRRSVPFDIAPDAATRAQLAAYLDVTALRKFRFIGELGPLDARDWVLRAQIGATVVQPCAVTGAAVTTRIDEPVLRKFIHGLPEPDALEIEMPEDDTLEPLGKTIDIGAIALEALMLALPAYPRAPDAQLTGQLQAAPKGETPLSDEAVKPFAALAALRDTIAAAPQDDDPDQRIADKGQTN